MAADGTIDKAGGVSIASMRPLACACCAGRVGSVHIAIYSTWSPLAKICMQPDLAADPFFLVK